MCDQGARRAILAVAAVLAFAALCALSGCASADEGEAPDRDGSFQSTVESSVEIGDKSADSFAFSVLNSSGQSIVSFAVKLPGADSFSANMMLNGVHLKDGGQATVCVPRTLPLEDPYIVDAKIVFANGGTSVLHHLDLMDFETMTILLEGKIGYVSYQSKAAGRLVSTLDLQTHYYNVEDPTAAERDKLEGEEEKRRLEKLEEDLKATEEEFAAQASENGNAAVTDAQTTEDTQGADIEDDPLEVSHESPDEG